MLDKALHAGKAKLYLEYVSISVNMSYWPPSRLERAQCSSLALKRLVALLEECCCNRDLALFFVVGRLDI